MGGKNHQPCGSYLVNSTLLSRSTSQGAINLQKANIALEDLILDELCGRCGDFDSIVKSLKETIDSFIEVTDRLDDLHKQMRENHFKDLPSLHVLNLSVLGNSLAIQGIVSSSAWDEVQSIMEKKGFYGIIELFRTRVLYLRNLSQDLLQAVLCLESDAKNGVIERVLEENRRGNIKVPFAKLFTEWSYFEQIFLASSMLSTELYYQYNNYGSLVDFPLVNVA